jgi:hypothetical protein
MSYLNGSIDDTSGMILNSDTCGRKAKRARSSNVPIDLTSDGDSLCTSNISSRRRMSSSHPQHQSWAPSTYMSQSPLEPPKPLEGDNALMNYMHQIVKKVPFSHKRLIILSI